MKTKTVPFLSSELPDLAAENILDAQATLGEGCCWDEKTQRLYWLDILGCEVHIYNPKTGRDIVHKTPYHVTLVHPTQQGDLILATRHGIARMDPDTGAFEALVDPESDLPGNRFNDGKPGPDGRLYAGTMNYDEARGKAHLWRIEPDLTYTKLLDGVSLSNGMGWSPDGNIFYYIDSPTGRVDAFDFDKQTGAITHRRPVVVVPPEMGGPDGMTVDAEGFIWTALWGGYCVARWNPSSGALVQKVTLPCPHVTCVCFGGPQLDTLYITTAKRGNDTMPEATEPASGDLFSVKPGIKGLPAYVFGKST